jgi:hypothetical protein
MSRPSGLKLGLQIDQLGLSKVGRELVLSIRNAVIPVAGLGTRLLPATKSQPKEMLPVGKKPIVQYIVEELSLCGMERFLFVTGRGKSSIEDHFDIDADLIRTLREGERRTFSLSSSLNGLVHTTSTPDSTSSVAWVTPSHTLKTFPELSPSLLLSATRSLGAMSPPGFWRV